MYWVKIGEVHYDLAEACRVRDHRELTAEEKARPERNSLGETRPKPYVSVCWRGDPKWQVFHGDEAEEFMGHFEKFMKLATGDAASGRTATD